MLATTALLAALSTTVHGAANLINGNWYGQAVDRIIYTGWGQTGTYDKVVGMSNGQCQTEQVSYSGGMAPMDEVSWHFRGPMHLKQFAFYAPGTGNSKRGLRTNPLERRHSHGHHKKAVGDIVTATINGQVVTWANTYGGPATSVSSSSVTTATPPMKPSTTTTRSVSNAAPTKASAPVANAGAGNWGRQAYYNVLNATADGLVFLNNMGGQGSGVFDTTWGNSLSYASADAKAGSASPQVLANTLIEDNAEVIIYSDKPCQGNDCGFYRPGSVAYHGFEGDTKLFLLEFDMPMSGTAGFNMDMPAAWMLNAAVARTQQYGGCSCWASGCGEWDIFEILDSGNDRAKSTLHAGSHSGGESDYFERPTSQTMKAAVIFDGSHSAGHILRLPDDAQFSAVLADRVVVQWTRSSAIQASTKVFKLGS